MCETILSGQEAYEILTRSIIQVTSRSMHRAMDNYALTIFPDKVDTERLTCMDQVEGFIGSLSNKTALHQVRTSLSKQPVQVQFFFFERYLVIASGLNLDKDSLFRLPNQELPLLVHTMTQTPYSIETASKVLKMYQRGLLPQRF